MQRAIEGSRRRVHTTSAKNGSRAPVSRAASATPTINGRVSPAVTTIKARSPGAMAGSKRKEREFDHDTSGEDTNITVVVRCRGRNEREIRENSGMVVSTDGVKGKSVELVMGPSSLSNKTYHFDKVFSPAADQSMIFNEVVAPVLDEVVSGYNCTIFAYGQTGTGKTYTMSGDISDTMPLPDDSGIIPRSLHSLFRRLDNQKTEYSVKCSFIELYNEELRDLISADDGNKLKIFDDSNKKSHTSTLVQGVEETYIRSAAKGLELLKIGSHKRQVAATRCNDLSSRSHTVFTITVLLKQSTEGSDDNVITGKLNLVDLAGSENIQRSGAEHKRAAEAGLINKSLLTLGRVINALVDKSSHIPYRESKLTRLLQDSLGGRTKTCIIATLSPAKGNLEETMSTLDYAFRAKNIRNKPQTNQSIPKRTLFREFSTEIEKLKGELIAARHRNGVYLTPETYENMMAESESRRILTEEQRDKIGGMEAKLKDKYQELLVLTSDFNEVSESRESALRSLQESQDVIQQSDVVLKLTQQSLEEESMLRTAHETTEKDLQSIGQSLLKSLGRTTTDVDALHQKLRRRSALHSVNSQQWSASQAYVHGSLSSVEQRLDNFVEEHRLMMNRLSASITSAVSLELSRLTDLQSSSASDHVQLCNVRDSLGSELLTAKNETETVIGEVLSLRETVQTKLGKGLANLSDATQCISAGVIKEIEALSTEMQKSYSTFGHHLSRSFHDIAMSLQTSESEVLRLGRQLEANKKKLATTQDHLDEQMANLLHSERVKRAEERNALLATITSLINQSGEQSDLRFEAGLESAMHRIKTDITELSTDRTEAAASIGRLEKLLKDVSGTVATSHAASDATIERISLSTSTQCKHVQVNSEAVHAGTSEVIRMQEEHMNEQMQAFDDVVLRLKKQNGAQHDSQMKALGKLSDCLQASARQVDDLTKDASFGMQNTRIDAEHLTHIIGEAVSKMQTEIQFDVKELLDTFGSSTFVNYNVTGLTPQKSVYDYPRELPQTEEHTVLLDRFRRVGEVLPSTAASPASSLHHAAKASPAKSSVYADPPDLSPLSDTAALVPENDRCMLRSAGNSEALGLKEIDINIASSDSQTSLHGPSITNKGCAVGPELKQGEICRKSVKRHAAMVIEGRENRIAQAQGALGGRSLRSGRNA